MIEDRCLQFNLKSQQFQISECKVDMGNHRMAFSNLSQMMSENGWKIYRTSTLMQ